MEENQRQTIEVVAEARRYGAHVEGEIEAIKGVEDGIGTDTETRRQSLETAITFIRETGVDVFAPSIGNAHGVYSSSPDLDFERVTALVAATDTPIALHGGSGMTDAQFHDLIARGCAKVNISTALKIEFMQSSLAFLKGAEAADKWDPPSLFADVRSHIVALTDRSRRDVRQRGQGLVTMPFLIFDCDGVLADTERNGHLPAFNQTFEEFGVPVRWSDADYAVKVLIGGGKERMASLLTPEFVAANGLPADEEGQRELLAQWHRRKTAIYTDLVESGALPARPGIARIAGEADAAGWRLAVASTSAEASVRAVLEHAVGDDLAARFSVFAGDIVAAQEAGTRHLPARARRARRRSRRGGGHRGQRERAAGRGRGRPPHAS